MIVHLIFVFLGLMLHPDFRSSVAAETTVMNGGGSPSVVSTLEGLLRSGSYNHMSRLLQEELQKNPGDKKLLALKRDMIIADYRNAMEDDDRFRKLKTYKVLPGRSGCQQGEISQEVLALMISRMMYVRRLAGIPDTVVHAAEHAKACQRAALMMDVNNRLDHYPDASWKCWNREAATTAGSSNLSLGYGFLSALMGQIEDDGEGNASCGHRRWILNPHNRVFSIGSTDRALCLKVFGHRQVQPVTNYVYRDQQAVTWPSADFFPIELLPERWSFSMDGADFSQSSVSVSAGGKPLKMKKERVASGYGLNTLVWKLEQRPQEELTYKITISRVKKGGTMRTFSYETVFIRAAKAE